MKKQNKKILLGIITLLLMPVLVFASDGETSDLTSAIFIEAFLSIHMSECVLYPIATMISAPENRKRTFWILFAIRAAILLYFDFFVTPMIAIFDFFAVFIGILIVVPFLSAITKKKPDSSIPKYLPRPKTTIATQPITKCAKCQTELKTTQRFCPKCGVELKEENIIVEEPQQPKYVLPSMYDPMYSLSENLMIETFLKKEMAKAGIDEHSKLIPAAILKRKKILNLIFALLLLIYISLIFFHFPIGTYILGLIILIVFFILTRKYNLIKYLSKEIKARPQEKISNIVMNVKSSFIPDNSLPIFIVSTLVAILLPLGFFYNPRIIYEQANGGYGVRFYIYGVTNFKTATIPSTYKGEPIVTLRGNTFSNMPFLEKVELPDSIVEIRGQAFKNCTSLKGVRLPSNLQYLGGGAFYNAKSLKSIELPDSITTMGGETFYGAKSLESVKLPKYLSEIRGDSFEYCTSLKSISIPDTVTRIGGHAFYGDSSLSEVIISENSQLSEIGSSAFRQCPSLTSITIPRNTYVNERAFKESPTSVHRYGESDYNNNYNYDDNKEDFYYDEERQEYHYN